MKERGGVGRFHHGCRVERAVSEGTVAIGRSSEAAVLRKVLDAARGVHDVFDVRVEVAILVLEGGGEGARVGMTETASPAGVRVAGAVDEERLPALDVRVVERYRGQVKVRLSAERQL